MKPWNTPEYRAWSGMKTRCYNRKNNRYQHYGGRGVRVCDRWRNSFDNFLSDMGLRPLGMSLNRKDNNKDYEPKNCEWATEETQQNNRSNNIRLTLNGETLTMSQWAKRLNIGVSTLRQRIRYYGWPIERALSATIVSWAECGRITARRRKEKSV